jgi:hypothetical protein
VIGGRYGLSSKELAPAMVAAVFRELAADQPRPRFTVGIVDDVTHLSLPVDRELDIEPPDVVRAVSARPTWLASAFVGVDGRRRACARPPGRR